MSDRLVTMPTGEFDVTKLPDYWRWVAYNIEQSLIESGAKAGHDYTFLDLWKLAEPLVLARWTDEIQKLELI